MFILHMSDREGENHVLKYDPHTSTLIREDGQAVVAPGEGILQNWEEVVPVSKDKPGKKSNAPKRLKIQLGLACNYSCSYCLQGHQIAKAAATSTKDVMRFLDGLDDWLVGSPERIEFWGGEPFLYWKKIEVLVPELRKLFPKARISTVTNGTLLTKEIVDKLMEWEIAIGISHDGPAQHVRGPDPFDDPKMIEVFEYAAETLTTRNLMGFNAVLSTASYDPDAVIDWFLQRFPNVPVTFEGVVHDYEGSTNSRFTQAQLKDLTETVAFQIMRGTATRAGSISQRVSDFFLSLANRRPSYSLSQKCGMDKADSIAVDLLGNVMTCQNVGGQGEHKIGTVNDFSKIRLHTSTHWSHKEECTNCPVLQICKGSCMYLEGDQWIASCNAEFAYNSGVLAGALFVLTGLVLRRIEGHIVRPGMAPE